MAIKVKSIWLDRAEGPSEECVSKTFKTFDDADKQIRSWSHSTRGGYDKVDFKVTWVDGETYEGRYDMVKDDVGNLEGHVRQVLMFHAGLYRPPTLSREQYEKTLERYDAELYGPKKADYKKFMDTYFA